MEQKMQKHEFETNVVKPSLITFENEVEYRLISTQDEATLDFTINEIESFMKNNEGKGKSELEKDELYKGAIDLWNKYATTLRDVNFTFYLDRRQYNFLTDLLIKYMEYDVNTLFLAIELTNMLGDWNKIGTSKDDLTLNGYTTDATEITYIYHLISKHKVKGLSASSYRFAEVLRRIGNISKIIAYYDTYAKNMSKEIQEWVASFEDGVLIEPKSKKKKDLVTKD